MFLHLPFLCLFSLFTAVSPAIGPLRRSLCHPSDPRLSRSKSDMLHPPDTPPSVHLAPPARVNPFSQREDLNGGKIKLFDTPSKSVISLTFTPAPPTGLRRPFSLRVGRRQTCAGGTGAATRCRARPPLTSRRRPTPSSLRRSPRLKRRGELTGQSYKTETGEQSETQLAGDSGLPLSLEPLSLDQEDEEKEEEEEEPMDCTSSPDTQDESTSSPYSDPSPPPSHSSTPLQPSTPPFSNGWGVRHLQRAPVPAPPLLSGQQQCGGRPATGMEHPDPKCRHHHQQQRLPLPWRPGRLVPVRLRQRPLSGPGGGGLLSRLLPRRPPLPLAVSPSSAAQEPLQEPERGPRGLARAAQRGTQGSATLP